MSSIREALQMYGHNFNINRLFLLCEKFMSLNTHGKKLDEINKLFALFIGKCIILHSKQKTACALSTIDIYLFPFHV